MMTPYKYKQARAKAKVTARYQEIVDRYNKFYWADLTVAELLRMHGINEGSMFDPTFNAKMPQYYMDAGYKVSPKVKRWAELWVKQLEAK